MLRRFKAFLRKRKRKQEESKKLASLYFTAGQDIKRQGKHICRGYRADAYYIIDKDLTLRLYVEESKQKMDWKENFKLDTIKSSFNNERYHRGFYENALLLHDMLLDLIPEVKKCKVICYSQGAGVADIELDRLDLGTIKSKMYSFGNPNNCWVSKRLKKSRINRLHFVQGWDFVFNNPFWLKKYGKTAKLKGRGNPIKSHNYYHLDKK